LRIANISQSGPNATQYPEKAIIELMDVNTRLLSISAVQYASGLRMNLELLGKACKSYHALFCIDAIQQIGALQFDVQAIDADFVIADGHKWMLGPEGLALFYCKQSSMQALELQQFGWHMVEDLYNFNDIQNWQPANTARRFECGSPNTLTTHALQASVGLLLERGMHTIEQAVLSNVQTLIKLFSQLDGVSILSPTDITRHAGIFTFNKAAVDSQQLYNFLVNKGVVCAPRGDGVRFSPHYHNQVAEFEQLAEWVNTY